MEDFLNENELVLWSGSEVIENNYSLTSICASLTPQAANGSLLPMAVAIGARVFHIFYGLFQLVLGIILNVFIVVLVFKFKKLRTSSSIIAVQIAIVNLTLTVVYGIPAVVNNIAGHWILGLELCLIFGAVFLMTVCLRSFLIFSFSLDHFASVFAPFFYPKHSRKIITVLCLFAWIVGLIISLVSIPPILDCYIFSEPLLRCSMSSRCSSLCEHFQTIILIPTQIMSQCVPIGFFAALYLKGRKLRREESQMLELTSTTMNDRHWRALKTFFLLFVAVFLVTFPPTVFVHFARLFGTLGFTLSVQLASDVFTLLIITDPIIILRNADFREAFVDLMKLIKNHCRATFKGKK